ncbi:nuclear receptor coactivator 6-like [Panonychus citri]|uniref:nuclear receptor coactivator 6-like n=1 Tax=Panonychus citri TaxID=50023 RepID=UPI002307D8B0|nr:nuclear receptor coactivator 6-like [Panonychus citri]
MHLHMTPQSGSHLPRPPCPPNGDRTTGPPPPVSSSSSSSSTSTSSQQQQQQQNHHHHQQQQQQQQIHHQHHQQQQKQQIHHQQQSHHHLTSQASSSLPAPPSSSDSNNSSTMSRPPPGIISPYANPINNYQAMLMIQQQQELLWQKYPEMRGITVPPGNLDNRLLSPYQINDWKLIQERERQLQEKLKHDDKMKEREAKERDKQMRERERAEREKKQRDAVQQHFEESLRIANQKQRVSSGWPGMGKGNTAGGGNQPHPVRSQQGPPSHPPVTSSGPNSMTRSYIPMYNGDISEKDDKSTNSSNSSSRSSSSATSSHQPALNNSNNNNNNNNSVNNLVHPDVRSIRNLEQQQRHHQQSSSSSQQQQQSSTSSPSPSKSQQQSRSSGNNKLDYRSAELNFSQLHAAATQQQYNVLSQQQSHSPNGPQHPLHLIHAPSWGIPRPGLSSDGTSHSQGKGSQSHQQSGGHPGGLPLHLQGHHGPVGPGQLNPSQLHLLNNMNDGAKLMAHYDVKSMNNLMRENSSSPLSSSSSTPSSSKKANASPVNSTNNNSNNNNTNNSNHLRDNSNCNNNNSGSRSDHHLSSSSSKHGPNHRANSEIPGPYGYTPYGYPPPPPRSSGIKDTPPISPHHPPSSLPPPHLAVGKLNSSTANSISLTSTPNSRNCFSPMANHSLGRPSSSGPSSSSRPPPPAAHSGGSTTSSMVSVTEKREPSPLIDRSGTPIGRNTGTPLGRPPSASSSKHLSGKVGHQFNSIDRISPLYHNSTSQSSSSSTSSSSLQSGQQQQQQQPSGSSHSSSPFSQQSQPTGVPLMSAPPAHQSSSPGLATSRSNTPQLSSSNVQSHPSSVVLSSTSSSSSSSSSTNHPSLTNLSSSQDQPQNLVKSESKVRNSGNNSSNINHQQQQQQQQSLNSNISSKGVTSHHQGVVPSGYMKHNLQYPGEDHKLNLTNPNDRYSINGPNMEAISKQQHHHHQRQQQQQYPPITNSGVIPGAPGSGLYPHYMKGLPPTRYDLSGGQAPHTMGYDVSRLSRTSGPPPPPVPFNLAHPSSSFDGQLKGPGDHHIGSNNSNNNNSKSSGNSQNSYKVNCDSRMGTETINLDLHQTHYSNKGNSSINSFSGNNTLTISSSPASVSTALTITTSPLTSISPTGTIVKSGINSSNSNNGSRLISPSNLPPNSYLPPGIHSGLVGQSNFVNHHLAPHPLQQQPHPMSLTNNMTPLGPLSNPTITNGSSGSIIHGLPVISDKKLSNVTLNSSAKDNEYDQFGKRKGFHKDTYDLSKKIRKEDEDNLSNRSKLQVGVSPTDLGRRSSPNKHQSSLTINEDKSVNSITEGKKIQQKFLSESTMDDQSIHSSSKGTIETPMTITTTMLPPPSLNTASSSSPLTQSSSSNTTITVTPTNVTQSVTTTSITGPTPIISTSTTMNSESPVTTTTITPVVTVTSIQQPTIVTTTPTITSNETTTNSGPSKFHPKLKKAWLQRHSEAEVESNSNQSTSSSSISVTNSNNTVNNNITPTIIIKEEDKSKQTLPVTTNRAQQQQQQPSSQSTPSNHKVKQSTQNSKGGDQHSDTSVSSSPRVKRKISREEKNKKKVKKEPLSDEDGDETSSVSDFDFNGDKSNSSAPEKSSKSSKSGLIKKRVTSSRNISKRHKSSGGSNSGSGSENKKEDKLSKDARERHHRTKESKINARRGRKPKSSTRGSKESNGSKEKPSHEIKESKKKSSKLPELPWQFVKGTSPEYRKKTGAIWLQDGSCYDIAPRLPKCRECRMTPNQRSKKMPNIFCRFYAFRKLRYAKNGVLVDSGFSEPRDATHYDLKLWLPPETPCKDLDVETSKFLITYVGDQFCDLVKQEQQALKIHMGKDKTLTWKRVVQGVREMCDVCETTLFNIHWVCHKCGFVICIDCYKARAQGDVKEEDNPPRDRDEFQWLLCTNRQPHVQNKLMMTQIIAQTALNDVGNLLHIIRKAFKIEPKCGCDVNTIFDSNGLSNLLLNKAVRDKINACNGKNMPNGLSKSDSKSEINSKSDNLSKDSENSTLTGFSSESGSSPLFWLADVALSRKMGSDKSGEDGNTINTTGGDKLDDKSTIKGETDDCNFSTLRELLIRPTSKKKKGKSSKKGKKTKKNEKTTTSEDNENDGDDDEDNEDNEEEEEDDGEEEDDDETTSDELDEVEETRVKKKIKKEENEDSKVSTNSLSSSITTSSSSSSSSSSSTIVNSTSSTTTTTTTTTTSTSSKETKPSINTGGNSNSSVGVSVDKPSIKCESTKSTINLPSDSRKLEHYTPRFTPKRDTNNPPSRSCSIDETKKIFPNIPHTWLCSGRLLVFQDPKLPDNLKLFKEQWKRKQPVLISGINKLLDSSLWNPDEFNRLFGDAKSDVVNCKTGHVLPKLQMKKFWDGFENLNKRLKGDDNEFLTLKLKDWPPGDDFSDLLPDHYGDLMDCLPLPEYTRRDGCLNLAGRLPECFVRPDLGPKMYNAYGSACSYDKGTTNLHLDISDAVNIMVYVGIPKGAGSKSEDYQEAALKAIDEGGCDEEMKKRSREKGKQLGALWHIYESKDADSIRDLLNKVAKERGVELGAHFDPIHDQSWYLDSNLRDRLKSEYKIEGYSIAQCLGDAVFIPAGAPHQVRNLQSCIKVAGDFVSPENVTQCFNLTQEFRQLSDSHINHEDKLQIKNIIYHAIKDSLASLQNKLSEGPKSSHSHSHHHHHHKSSNSVNNNKSNNSNSNSNHNSSSTTSTKAH